MLVEDVGIYEHGRLGCRLEHWCCDGSGEGSRPAATPDEHGSDEECGYGGGGENSASGHL
jgi:hypothetical protein